MRRASINAATLFLLALLFVASPNAQVPMASASSNEELLIRGRVTDPAGQPLASATVSIFSEPAHELIDKAACDKEGVFVIKHIPPEGSISLVVTAPGHNIVTRRFSSPKEMFRVAPINFTLTTGDPGLSIRRNP